MQGSTGSFLVQPTLPVRRGRTIGEPTSPAMSCLQAQPRESRHLADFRRRLLCDAWLFPRCCRGFSHFGCGFKRRWQFQLRLFRKPVMAMVQRLDARSFFFRPQLSVSIFLALVLKVCRNRFSCHGQSMAELASSKLSNFGHSVTIHGPLRRGASWMSLSAKALDFSRERPYSRPDRTTFFCPQMRGWLEIKLGV
jgi:hypothetical protein